MVGCCELRLARVRNHPVCSGVARQSALQVAIGLLGLGRVSSIALALALDECAWLRFPWLASNTVQIHPLVPAEVRPSMAQLCSGLVRINKLGYVDFRCGALQYR